LFLDLFYRVFGRFSAKEFENTINIKKYQIFWDPTYHGLPDFSLAGIGGPLSQNALCVLHYVLLPGCRALAVFIARTCNM
jgi:hypothetical protein